MRVFKFADISEERELNESRVEEMSSCVNDALILIAVIKNTGVHYTCTTPPLDQQ